MKLRTTLLLGITILVAGIITSTVLAVTVVVDRAERRTLRRNLERSRAVFEELLGYRRSTFAANCRLLANEPRLRAVMATQGVSRASIIDVAMDLEKSHDSDLFLLTDGSGMLIGDLADPRAARIDLSKNWVIAEALASGHGAGVWISKERPYQVHACRIAFGSDVFGFIVLGHLIDDGIARAVQRQTGSTVVVNLSGRPVASAELAAGDTASSAELAAATVGARTEPVTVSLAGTEYVVVGGPFPHYQGKTHLTYAVLLSLDEALAPGRRLVRSVLAIAAIAVVAALLLALILARRLSRPVDDLVQVTDRIAKGHLEARARLVGASEIKALAAAMNRMVAELDRSRRELSGKQRLEREMEIAMKIQTSILPKSFEVSGVDIAAKMIPATEVGGDYYDILPGTNGCWIGIGDVAGHGLTAGLEMLMVQSVVAALVHRDPDASPKEHMRVLNHVVHDNIRNRLVQDEHVTLTLLRYTRGGVVTFAGAHEEILVCRAAGACERIGTPGTWVGVIRDIGRVTRDSSFLLGVNELAVLYTDGITEARNAAGEQFGIDRLCKLIEDHRTEPVDRIVERVFTDVQAWQAHQDDDLSLVIFRRKME